MVQNYIIWNVSCTYIFTLYLSCQILISGLLCNIIWNRSVEHAYIFTLYPLCQVLICGLIYNGVCISRLYLIMLMADDYSIKPMSLNWNSFWLHNNNLLIEILLLPASFHPAKSTPSITNWTPTTTAFPSSTAQVTQLRRIRPAVTKENNYGFNTSVMMLLHFFKIVLFSFLHLLCTALLK